MTKRTVCMFIVYCLDCRIHGIVMSSRVHALRLRLFAVHIFTISRDKTIIIDMFKQWKMPEKAGK